MNVGDYLVSKSPLGSGSALAHLLAVTQGSGTGPAKTVFASQMAVCIEAPQITLIRKPSVKSSADVRPATQSQSHDAKKKRIDVVTQPARMSLLTTDECLTVSAGTHGASFVVRLDEGRMTVRQKGTAEMIDD